MGALLGPVGGLEVLPCASSLQVSSRPAVRSRTLSADGTMHVDMEPARAHRVWDVDVSTARPEQAALLQDLTAYQRELGVPFVFYSEDAQVENLLDPEAARMDLSRWTGLLPGGARHGGWPQGTSVPRFLTSGACPDGGGRGRLVRVPVPRGRMVTVSAYLTAYQGRAASLYVYEVDPEGATVREAGRASTTGVLDRAVVSFETSLRATTLTIEVAGAATVVAPAVTLTAQALPWAAGAGCLNAVLVGDPSKTVQLAFETATGWGRRSGYAWSVEEIGKVGDRAHG